MRKRHKSNFAGLFICSAISVAGCVPTSESGDRVLGQHWELGDGKVTTYGEIDESGLPESMGIVFSPDALNNLPSTMSDEHHCFDRDANGTVEKPMECFASHEAVIPLPDVLATRSDFPFKWVLFNWNAYRKY
jgi:hypothetical protein